MRKLIIVYRELLNRRGCSFGPTFEASPQSDRDYRILLLLRGVRSLHIHMTSFASHIPRLPRQQKVLQPSIVFAVEDQKKLKDAKNSLEVALRPQKSLPWLLKRNFPKLRTRSVRLHLQDSKECRILKISLKQNWTNALQKRFKLSSWWWIYVLIKPKPNLKQFR